MVPTSLKPSADVAENFPSTKLPKSLDDDTLWKGDDGEGWFGEPTPPTPAQGMVMLGTQPQAIGRESLTPLNSKFPDSPGPFRCSGS